jgi:hypothetical protein
MFIWQLNLEANMNSTSTQRRIPPNISIAPRLIVVSSIFYSIALSLFVTRVYVRYQTRKLGKDDFALGAGVVRCSASLAKSNLENVLANFWYSQASGTALFIIQSISVAHGTGRHIFYLSWEDFQLQFLLNIIVAEFYVWAVTMIKMSLSFMLLRIQNSRPWKIGLYALIFPQLGLAIASVFLDVLRCYPMRAAWDFSIPRDRCHPLLTYRTSILISSGMLSNFPSLD